MISKKKKRESGDWGLNPIIVSVRDNSFNESVKGVPVSETSSTTNCISHSQSLCPVTR